MKRALLLVSLMLILSLDASAVGGDIASIKNSNAVSRELNLLFIKGLSRESVRSYTDALYAYDVMLSRVQNIVNSSRSSNENVSYALPYAVAAAYRKAS